MIAQGAASVPGPGGPADQALVPSVEELRLALRPPELPLPAPRTALEVAHRVSDLIRAERVPEAVALARVRRDAAGPVADRTLLVRARIAALAPTGSDDEVGEAVTDLLTLLHGARRTALAEAVAAVAAENGLRRPPGRGRRRGSRPAPDADLLAVVRQLDLPRRRERSGGRGTADVPPTPRVLVARRRAALQALPGVREHLVEDPEPFLLVRLAQALEESGQVGAAVTPALDALEVLADRAPDAGVPADPHRVAIAARAVLARTLSRSHPREAVRHAVTALRAMRRIDDPPLRIGLITDLLNALMAADLPDHAAFTAGRLASLQRTLRREELRLVPLLAVATQRVRSGRDDAARVALEDVRRLARELRDRRATMEAARLGAILAERAGDLPGALLHLRRTAADAHWLADDLATPPAERGPFLRAELEALALAMRRAMDLGETRSAQAAARAIERRTRPEGGRIPLPAPLLWDHRVDARVGELVAVGDALVRDAAARRARDEAGHGCPDGSGAGEGGSPAAGPAGEGTDLGEADYLALLDRAREVIALAPRGHEARRRYWEAYLEERHAAALASRGRRTRARRSARRAVEAWREQDAAPADLARAEALLAGLA